MNVIRALTLHLFLFFNLPLSSQTISDFSLTNAIDESSFSLSNYHDAKGIAIIFTSNYCPYAKLYEDRILNLYAKYEAAGINFLLVNSNNPALSPADKKPQMKDKAESKGYPFPYLVDNNQQVSKLLGATKNPEAFLLKPTGSEYKVVYRGSIDDNPQNVNDVHDAYFQEAVEMLIRNRPVPQINSRPIGCMIKI